MVAYPSPNSRKRHGLHCAGTNVKNNYNKYWLKATVVTDSETTDEATDERGESGNIQSADEAQHPRQQRCVQGRQQSRNSGVQTADGARQAEFGEKRVEGLKEVLPVSSELISCEVAVFSASTTFETSGMTAAEGSSPPPDVWMIVSASASKGQAQQRLLQVCRRRS
uniref:Uncharacterized protein n=1 Tax=Mycena chlorophos TaxID=658473 RepID=A0ABQ0LKS8_MYCCL|nr:predicted protein [Mycena chlorophos]